MFFKAVAIIVVAVPAEKTDIHKACAYGYPGRAEVDGSKLFKHVPPSLIGMRGGVCRISRGQILSLHLYRNIKMQTIMH